MIKVRVLRGIRTGLPITSGLAALSGVVTACAPAQEHVGADDSAYTVTAPGTGVFELTWASGAATGFTFTAKGSTDEYVRALQQMTFAVPAYYLWLQLYPHEPLPEDLDRLRQLSARVTVAYYADGDRYAQTTVATVGWEGNELYALRATTGSFSVDRRAHAMRFSLEITDGGASPPVAKSLDEGTFFEQPVIGGRLPDKTLLFDTLGSERRTRVLEGGGPVQDAELAIAYTDWRAATLVDAASIDRQIGTATSYGRFGAIEVPIYGDVEYEITCGAGFDGAWQDETALAPNRQSRLMPRVGRTAYEGSVFVPAGVERLQLYFHVRAFLKVDYSRHADVTSRRYPDGARVLVRERWDNENDAPNDAYELVTESR